MKFFVILLVIMIFIFAVWPAANWVASQVFTKQLLVSLIKGDWHYDTESPAAAFGGGLLVFRALVLGWYTLVLCAYVFLARWLMKKMHLVKISH